MLHKFFMSQWKYPAKGDWTFEVKENLEEFNINMTLDEIKMKSKDSFTMMVKIKTKEYTLNYLLDLKDEHSQYSELKLQKYLKNGDLNVQEVKNLYRFRTNCAKFKENMRSSYAATPCPFCLVQPDNQKHSVQCPEVQKKVKIKGNYSDVF